MPGFKYFFSSLSIAILRKFPCWESSTWLAAREAWSLASRGYAGEHRLKLLKEQIRWAVLSAFKSKAALQWFQILKNPALSKYAQIYRRLAFKPLRVYMSSRWGIEKKIKIINDTYNFIQLSGTPLQNALIRTEGTNLATISISADSHIQVILGHNHKFRKEGELVVSMHHSAQGSPMVSMAFSLEQQNPGEWTMYIGCVQGGCCDLNKTVSKAMHGLRPKAFMVFVAQEIACALGVKHILGIGNAIHSHKRKHIIHIPHLHGLSFDYDSLWADAGGTSSADGWYTIPAQFQRRPYESIKSHKRAMYHRRYNSLANVSEQIHSTLLAVD